MNILLLIITGILLLILFMLSAFFSGCETALFSLSPVQVQRIRQRDSVAGARLEKLLGDPALTLSTLLVGNTLVNFAIATLGYVVAERFVPGKGAVIAIPSVTLALLLFGEVAPKRLAVVYAERLAGKLALALVFWLRLLRPFNIVLTACARVLKKSLRRERRALSDDELRTVMELGEEQGVLDAGEASMADGVMRLSELRASDAMTPRVDMVGFDLDTSEEEQLRVARQARFRYLPAYFRTPDAVEGFLDVVSYLLQPVKSPKRATLPAMFVPENMLLDELLISFQRNNSYIACVLDEYGGTAGLITRGDILELITAELGGDSDEDDNEMRQLADGSWLIDGTMSLEEVNHRLDLELDADDADRLAGWMTLHAGRLLQVGESVEAQGCRATVRRIIKRRIGLIQFEVLELPGGDEDEGDTVDDYEYEDDIEDDAPEPGGLL